MSETTGIAWCDHTFNPWWGCSKVSEACANCYAERQATRYGNDCFGIGKPRRFFDEKHWAEPLKWNAKAQRDGVRRRVFCASMADVFDGEVPALERAKVWRLIAQTPHLDWLLLTKRPEYLRDMLPPDHLEKPWRNLWLGVTVENQKRANERLPLLMTTPARVRFVSIEPQVGQVDLIWYLDGLRCDDARGRSCDDCPHGPGRNPTCDEGPRLDWVICGGESGPKARPIDLAWVRSLRDQCATLEVPFFFKQESGLRPTHLPPLDGEVWAQFPKVTP